jgi:hypothetical protein
MVDALMIIINPIVKSMFSCFLQALPTPTPASNSLVLIYWFSLTHIPRGMLDKIRRKCFSLLWTGKQEKKGIPLVKWDRKANLEEAGGWRLKNNFVFGQASAAKSV